MRLRWHISSLSLDQALSAWACCPKPCNDKLSQILIFSSRLINTYFELQAHSKLIRARHSHFWPLEFLKVYLHTVIQIANALFPYWTRPVIPVELVVIYWLLKCCVSENKKRSLLSPHIVPPCCILHTKSPLHPIKYTKTLKTLTHTMNFTASHG